jgi:drug/metabolite transporter (DMT)-like permease
VSGDLVSTLARAQTRERLVEPRRGRVWLAADCRGEHLRLRDVRRSGLIVGVACAGGATLAVGSSVAVLGLLTDYPALASQAVRYGLAAALLVAVALAGQRGLPKISGRDALQLAVLAATGLVAFDLLVLGALEEAEPAAFGVGVGCVPVGLALTGPLLARRAPVARVVGRRWS